LRVSIPVILILTFTCALEAQDASSDQAKATLKQAISQYESLDFQASKASFLKIDRSSLGQADKKVLDEYLGKVDTAIRKQRSAREAYSMAIKSLKDGDIARAEQLFAKASASEYIDGPTRQDAKAQLALVKKRLELAAAAQAKAAPAPPKVPEIKAQPVEAKTGTAVVKTEVKAEPDKPVVQADDASRIRAQKMLEDIKARQQQVDELIMRGQAALDESQPERAVGYFKQALALDPDSQQAQKLLDQSRKMTLGVTSNNTLTRLEERRRISRQASDLAFDKAMTRSREVISRANSKGEFNSAADAARVAQNVLETNKTYYTAQEYQAKLLEVDEQLKYVEMRREEWEKEQVQIQMQQIRIQQQQRKQKLEGERQAKIERFRENAETHLAEYNYEAAADELDRILVLDPKDNWAAGRKEMVEQFILALEERDLDKTQLREEQKSLLDLREAEIPWYELLLYPRNWKEITKIREPFSATGRVESEADRAVRAKLNQRIQKLEFDESEFGDVIDFLQDVSGANFHVKWMSLDLLGIDRSTPVTIRLDDVKLEKALRVILEDVGGFQPLSFVVDEGVITVSTKDDLETRTITRVYDVRDLIVRVPNFAGPSLELEDVGAEGGGGGGGDLFADEDRDEEEGEVLSKGELINEIIQMIADTVDPNSWRIIGQNAGPGETGSIRHLHGQLIITQTEENHGKVLDLINQLRESKALQVAIEARFITVNTGFLNSIGIDLDFYFNIGSALGSTTVTDPWTGATVPTKGGTSGWGTTPPGSNNFTPISALQGSNVFTNMLGVSTPVPNSIGGLMGNQSLTVAGTFLDDIQVDFLIQATQAHSATRSLTAPRLTLFNGQRAYVSIGTYQSYVRDLTPVVAENAVSFDPEPAYVNTGTVLDVEATVSADRRYVTLTVRPQVTLLNNFSTYVVTAAGTDAAGNPLGSGFLQQPNVTVQRLETTVSVPDGGTLLLGGQKLAGEVEREQGVPLLSKVPVINRAFTNRGTVRDEQTLLILIKPKIIIQREEEERQFP